MRRHYLPVLALCLAFSIVARARPPFPFHFTFSAGDSFAFLGTTATAEGSYCRNVEIFFLTRYWDRPVSFYNAGCRQDTTLQAINRLETELRPLDIDYAFVMLGAWDDFRNHDAANDPFAFHYAELLARLRKARIHPFLVSPPIFDVQTHQLRASDESYRFRGQLINSDYNAVLARRTVSIQQAALRGGHRFMNAWGALNQVTVEQRKTNPVFSLMPDALIPDEGGHAIIAMSIVESLACRRQDLGQLTLSFQSSTKSWSTEEITGSIRDLTGDRTRVAFRWKARSLPWAWPDAAMLGVDMAAMNQRFNRQLIHIVGLEEGEYTWTIDGESMPGTFSHVELAKGIALHEYLERPQWQRAKALVTANQERYKKLVHPLRDHWESLQRVQTNAPGDDEAFQQTLAQRQPAMTTLARQAREQFAKLYQKATPKARSFEFRLPAKQEP